MRKNPPAACPRDPLATHRRRSTFAFKMEGNRSGSLLPLSSASFSSPSNSPSSPDLICAPEVLVTTKTASGGLEPMAEAGPVVLEAS